MLNFVQDQGCRRGAEEFVFHGRGHADLPFFLPVELSDLPEAHEEDAVPYWRHADFLQRDLTLLAEFLLWGIRRFRATAAAGAAQAMEIVHKGLQVSPPSSRRKLAGEPRRALVFSLQELMAATTTAEAAFRSLALLAETETEDYDNNATRIFWHGADPLSSQIPLALSTRLRVLQEMLAPERDAQAAMIALEAARNTLGPGRPMILIPSRGPRPAGGLPIGITWGDVRAYCAGLVDAIAKAADDPRLPVRRKAKSVWPSAVERLVYDLDGNAGLGVAAFEQIVDRILREDPEFSVADTIETLILCRSNLGGALAGRGTNGAADLVAALNGFLTKFKTSSFNVRLRWRVGDSYVDGPRPARTLQRNSLVECSHMSGLVVRSYDRWPRWGTRIGSQTWR